MNSRQTRPLSASSNDRSSLMTRTARNLVFADRHRCATAWLSMSTAIAPNCSASVFFSATVGTIRSSISKRPTCSPASGLACILRSIDSSDSVSVDDRTGDDDIADLHAGLQSSGETGGDDPRQESVRRLEPAWPDAPVSVPFPTRPAPREFFPKGRRETPDRRRCISEPARSARETASFPSQWRGQCRRRRA